MTEGTFIDIDALRAEEAFVADTQLLLHEVMVAKGITRAELADRLGVSRARVSQLFSPECRNFTVRLLARAMFALGERGEVSCNWTRERERESHASTLAASLAEPATNLVALWQGGEQMVPDRGCGRHGVDPRIKAILRSSRAVSTEGAQSRAAA